jgi:hypothetical protein
MEKRAFARVPSFLDAKLFYGDYSYDALILNLSQNGINFSTEVCLSSGLNIEISIPMETTELKVPFKIVRMSKTDMLSFRFGAELLSPSEEYLKFVHGRIASM